MPGQDGGEAPGAAGPELRRGLVLWLPLDEPTGAVTASDDSGHGNRSSLREVGAGSVGAWVAGRIGGALDLGAAASGGGYLRTESSPSLNRIGSGLSIAVWLWRTVEHPGVIVSRRASAPGSTLYRLSVEADGHLRLLLNDRRGVRLGLRSATPLPTGRWVHAAITWGRDGAAVYLDGQRVGQAPYAVPLAPDVSPLLVGAEQSDGMLAGFLPGRLDELLLYNRALSSVEVEALATGLLPPMAAPGSPFIPGGEVDLVGRF